MPLRTTVYLDENVLARLQRYIPQRGFSQLVNELLAMKLAELEQAVLETEMREGYLATRQERTELTQAWQAVDNEGWPV